MYIYSLEYLSRVVLSLISQALSREARLTCFALALREATVDIRWWYLTALIDQKLSTIQQDHIKSSQIAMPRLNNDQRNQAIGMLNAGSTVAEVSQLFSCTRKTIERLRRRFQIRGNVWDRPRSGRPRGTTAADDRYITV